VRPVSPLPGGSGLFSFVCGKTEIFVNVFKKGWQEEKTVLWY
jgi:hypothetical protein